MENNTVWKILVAVLVLVIIAGAVILVTSMNQTCQHTFEETILTPATCVGDGVMQRKCTNCGYTEVDTIVALGHDDKIIPKKNATCIEEGHIAYVACARCNRSTLTSEGILPKENHKASWVVTTPNTCTSSGYRKFVCDVCSVVLDEEEIAPSHNIVTDYAVAATCYRTGLTEGSHCSGCSLVFVAQEVVPMKDHNLRTVSEKAPTCKDGNYKYHYCINDNCGYNEMSMDPDKYIIPALYSHIFATEAVIVPDTYKDPTCTNAGGYYTAIYCTTCNTMNGDTLKWVEIPALGHIWVTNGAKAPTCTENGWEEYTYCGRCRTGNEKFSEIPALGHNEDIILTGKPADCTNSGLTDGTQCSVCKEVIVEQTVIPAYGHTEVTRRENEVTPTCTTDGKYDKVVSCATCLVELDRQTVVIPALDHVYVNHAGKVENCVETGWAEYQTCIRCDYTTYSVINALGHDKVNHEAKAATCTDIGWEAYETCSRCSYTTYVEIPALGHTTVVDAAKAPNCVDSGLTEGSHCSVCSTVLVAQQTIPATGHNINETIGKCTNAGCSEGFSLGLAYIFNADGTLTVAGLGECKDANVVIPAQLDGASVVAIAEGAFENNSNIKSVYIPDSVKVIGADAFNRCKYLEAVVIGNGVETIGDFAFFNCRSLSKVTIGSGVKTVGNDAFDDCPISEVTYVGTAAQWNSISFGSRNGDLTSATRKYI